MASGASTRSVPDPSASSSTGSDATASSGRNGSTVSAPRWRRAAHRPTEPPRQDLPNHEEPTVTSAVKAAAPDPKSESTRTYRATAEEVWDLWTTRGGLRVLVGAAGVPAPPWRSSTARPAAPCATTWLPPRLRWSALDGGDWPAALARRPRPFAEFRPTSRLCPSQRDRLPAGVTPYEPTSRSTSSRSATV